jgi:hypothetical protein
MAGKTGASGDKRCSNLFGLGRIYLHFNSGWHPMDLQEVHLWTIWTKPAHTSSLKQKEEEIGQRRVSREMDSDHNLQ